MGRHGKGTKISDTAEKVHPNSEGMFGACNLVFLIIDIKLNIYRSFSV